MLTCSGQPHANHAPGHTAPGHAGPGHSSNASNDPFVCAPMGSTHRGKHKQLLGKAGVRHPRYVAKEAKADSRQETYC